MISFFKESGPTYSSIKALLIIAVSALLVSGSAAAFVLFFHFQRALNRNPENHHIKSVVQTAERFEALPTLALEEMLNLSIDKPVNIEDFDIEDAKKQLLASHIFKHVEIKKIVPSTLYIDYSLKEPIGYLGEISNTFIDREGSVFPAFPYFTPKKLPEIFLGKTQPDKKQIDVIATLFAELKGVSLLSLDLRFMEENSLGRREIIVTLKVHKALRTLRLNPDHFAEQIRHYVALERAYLAKKQESHIIDLRLPMIAYLKEGTP